MDAAPFALLLVLCPDAAHLAADSFPEREFWQRLYTNPLSARLLPARHPDPEANHRLRAVRARALRGADPAYREGVLHRDDYAAWVRRHVLEADSVAFDLTDVFLELHSCHGRASVYFAQHPAPRGEGFLRYQVVPGEYEVWRAHVADYRAPWACLLRGVTARRLTQSSRPAP